MESFKYCLGSLLACSCYYNLSLASVILLKLTMKVLPLMVHPVDQKTNVRAYLRCGGLGLHRSSSGFWHCAAPDWLLVIKKSATAWVSDNNPASTVIISHCCY